MIVRRIFCKKVLQGGARGGAKNYTRFSACFGLDGTFGTQIACVGFSVANEANLSKNDAQKFLKVP